MKDNTTHNCPTPKGILIIIGGAESKEKLEDEERGKGHNVHMDILRAVVDLAESDRPSIEVITTAGSENVDDTFSEYRKSFQECGAEIVNHVHHESRAEVDLDSLKNRFEQADVIFFAGGDQLKLTSVYGGTELLLFLKNRYINDKVIVAGTSAGAMALSTPMIYGGVGRDEMIAGNVKVTTGLEFLRDVCIDTHFVNRGRFVRMAQVIAENPSSIGIGIEEDTAIIVKKGIHTEVIGNGVIIVIDASKSFGTNITEFDGKTPLTIRGLDVCILSSGQEYEIPVFNPPHR